MPLASADGRILPRWAQPHHCRVEKASGLWAFYFPYPSRQMLLTALLPVLLYICLEMVGKHFTLKIPLFRKLHFLPEISFGWLLFCFQAFVPCSHGILFDFLALDFQGLRIF